MQVTRRSNLLARLVSLLTAVILIYGANSALARSRLGCGQNSRWLRLIQQGGNQRLPSEVRERAYLQARALCPTDPAAYGGLGILRLQRQDYRGAIDSIRQGLAIAPRNAGLTLDLGVALLSAGQPQAALETLRAIPQSADSEFYLGMAYRSLRQHGAAREAFAKSYAMGKSDPYVLYEMIEQDRALHDEKQGLQDFKTFYARFPHSAWLHLLLGNAYISRHDTAGAEAEYQKAAKLNPNLPLAHFDLGRLAFDRGNYSEALAEFKAEVDVDPTFGEADLYAGTSLRRLGKDEQAIPYLKRAVARDPNFPLAYRELAVAQVQAGQLQAAARTLREGERRFPKEAAFPAQLARLERELGDNREAEAQSRLAEALSGKSNIPLSVRRGGLMPTSARGGPAGRDAATSSPRLPTGDSQTSQQMARLQKCVSTEDARCASRVLRGTEDAQLARNANYLNLQAQALILLHQEKPALTAVKRAIALDPHRADFFTTLGRIDQRLERQPEAIKCFLQAERMQPGAEAPVYYLGMSFFMLGYDSNDNGDYNRAARHFKAAIELDPRDDRAEFMLGVVDSIEFKLADAGKYLAAVLKMKPNNPYYHLHYGMLLSRTGHPAEAQREMRLAEKLDPSYPSTYLRLGDLDARLGNYAEARSQLETAVRLDSHLSSAYYTLGRVYQRLGLEAQARQALGRFQQTKSDEEKATDPIGASLNAVARH